MWNWLLVKLRLRTDWTDPRNAPPFVPDVPHEYQECPTMYEFAASDLPCCKRCGGGSLHPIHHGKQVPYRGVRLTEEMAREFDKTRGEC
jgi:hypothetical protein